MAFKMKGWSGHQKPSPIDKKLKFDFSKMQADFAKLQGNIQKLFKGENLFKPTSWSKMSLEEKRKNLWKGKFKPLTGIEKKEAKKLGVSEYQWRSGVNLTGDQRHKKRMFEKKHNLGRYAEETTTNINPNQKDEIDIDASTAETYTGGFGTGDKWKDIVESVNIDETQSKQVTPSVVDYGEGATTSDWKKESSTGWSLHELQQERDNVIKVKYGVNSPEYMNIQRAINAAYGY